MRQAAAVVPEAVPQLLGQDAAAGGPESWLSRPGRPPAVEGGPARRPCRPGGGPRRRRILAGDPCRDRRPIARSRPRSRPIGSSTTSASSRIWSRPPRAHPDLAAALHAGRDGERVEPRRGLVHGDVSPKNILIGPRGPVFLDAECAWYGDPAFDLAFCLNHLLLKCLWTPRRPRLPACFDALSGPISPAVAGSRRRRSRRAARAAPGLFLARVDGKSPVEYLTEERDQERVRRARAPAGAPARLGDVRAAWARGAGLVSNGHDRAVRGRRVWDSRGGPTVEAEVSSPAAPAAGRSRRPAPRRARRGARPARRRRGVRRPRRGAGRSPT